MNFLDLKEIEKLVSNLKPDKNYGNSSFILEINNFYLVIGTDNFDLNLNNSTLVGLSIEEIYLPDDNGIIVNPGEDERFCYFEWIKYFMFYNGKNSAKSYWGREIPKNDLYQIIKDIYKISKLQSFF